LSSEPGPIHLHSHEFSISAWEEAFRTGALWKEQWSVCSLEPESLQISRKAAEISFSEYGLSCKRNLTWKFRFCCSPFHYLSDKPGEIFLWNYATTEWTFFSCELKWKSSFLLACTGIKRWHL